MWWPFSRSKDKDRNIRILPYERHNAGEYYENLAFRLSLNDYLASVSPAEDFLHMTDEEVISRI
jgi:hypothetical protein